MAAKTLAPVLFMLSIAAGGCSIFDDDQPPIEDGGTGGEDPSDNEVCIAAIEAQTCEPGTNPLVLFDGGTANVTLIDDPSVAVGLLGGVLLNFGADADWVATSLTQNSVCTVACVSSCQDGQFGCFANPAMGGSCSFCGPSITEQGCADFIEACMPPGTGGDDSTGGATDTGGADESSGGAGVVYDCGRWSPTEVTSTTSAKYVPQTMVDDLVLYSGEPLAECDGVLFSENTDGRYYISEMGSDGMLQRIGLKKGDILTSLNGKDLDGADVLAKIFVENFYTNNGKPRQFGRRHRGFSLRVDRRKQSILIPIRVDPRQ